MAIWSFFDQPQGRAKAWNSKFCGVATGPSAAHTPRPPSPGTWTASCGSFSCCLVSFFEMARKKRPVRTPRRSWDREVHLIPKIAAKMTRKCRLQKVRSSPTCSFRKPFPRQLEQRFLAWQPASENVWSNSWSFRGRMAKDASVVCIPLCLPSAEMIIFAITCPALQCRGAPAHPDLHNGCSDVALAGYSQDPPPLDNIWGL